MRLDAPEFIRHFLLHVLPRGLQRIRHHGFLSNRRRETGLAECRRPLEVIPPRNCYR
jgi:Putative transposase